MDLNLQGGVCQLHKAAAIEDGREVWKQIDLRQVVTDEGPKMRCAATDGHILAVVDLSYAFGDDMPGRISQEAWATAAKLKANKKGCNGPVLRANGKVSIVGKDGEAIEFERPAFEADHSDFPKYELLIPQLRPGHFSFGVNPLLLLACAEAIGMTKDQPHIELAFNDTDAETPMLVRMAKSAAESLDALYGWTPPVMEPFPNFVEGGEETPEAYAEREKAHLAAFEGFLQAKRWEHDETVYLGTQALIRSVRALKEYPERPVLDQPILVTRHGVPNARGLVMPTNFND